MTRRSAALVVALATLVMTGTGIAWASGLTLNAKKLGAATLTTPAMFPVSVTLANKAGQPVGKVNNGDVITIVWSQLVDLPTLCSSWVNTKIPGRLNYTWSLVANGAGNDSFAPTGTGGGCASGLHVGSIDLGASGYDTNPNQAVEFTGSHVLSYDGTTTVLTITLGGIKNGASAGTVASGAAATWTCDGSLLDRSGRSCDVNVAQTATTVQF